jgi:hypothetical protein
MGVHSWRWSHQAGHCLDRLKPGKPFAVALQRKKIKLTYEKESKRIAECYLFPQLPKSAEPHRLNLDTVSENASGSSQSLQVPSRD